MSFNFKHRQDAENAVKLARERKTTPKDPIKIKGINKRKSAVSSYIAYIESCLCASFSEDSGSDNGECWLPSKCEATLYHLPIESNETGNSSFPTGGNNPTCLTEITSSEGNPIKFIVYNLTNKNLCDVFVPVTRDMNGHFWIQETPPPIVVTIQEDIGCNMTGEALDECGNSIQVCNKSGHVLTNEDKVIAFYHCGECDSNWEVYHVDRVTRGYAIVGQDSCGDASIVPISSFVALHICCKEYIAPDTALNPGFCFKSGDVVFLDKTCSDTWIISSVASSSKVTVLEMVNISQDSGDCISSTNIKIRKKTICAVECDSDSEDDGDSSSDPSLNLEFELKKLKYSRVKKASNEASGDSGGPNENCSPQFCNKEEYVLTLANADQICPDEDEGSGSDSASDDCPWEDLLDLSPIYGALVDWEVSGTSISGKAYDFMGICVSPLYSVPLHTGTECPEDSGSGGS
jgi:hypothetical protein